MTGANKLQPDRDHSEAFGGSASAAAAGSRDASSSLPRFNQHVESSTQHALPSSTRIVEAGHSFVARSQAYRTSNFLLGNSPAWDGSYESLPVGYRTSAPRSNAGAFSRGTLPQAEMIEQMYISPRCKGVSDAVTPVSYKLQGLHMLGTSSFQPSCSNIDAGTPTTSSIGDRRWTPISELTSSATTAPSAASIWTQSNLSSSPATDGFTPDTYAYPSPWNALKGQYIIQGQQSSPCPNQATHKLAVDSSVEGDLASRVERQLFTPSHSLDSNLDVQYAMRARSSGFRPMDALNPPTRPSPQYNAITPLPVPQYLQVTPQFAPCPSFSTRYNGKHVGSNASADHLLPDQNCALWLTNLPPNITYTQLLASIRGCGRIWCTFINEPNQHEHVTAAAKVVFFQPRAAATFLQAAWCSPSPLVIQGYRVKVSYNRIKYPEKACSQGESRVLIVTGHPRFVNEEALGAFFEQRFIFQTDRVKELVRTSTRAVVEWSFGSYRCQSQMGLMALEKDRPAGFEMVEYGEDPCEVGDTHSSYIIAMDRVHGVGL